MLGNQFHSFSRKKVSIAALAASSIVLASCSAGGDSEASAQWREATSVEDGGGMDALIETAQAEGSFNVMGLYEDWANYGELLKVFGEKYDIEINNDVSSGSSQDLVNAVKNRQGQDTSLDYLDTGMSFAEGAKTTTFWRSTTQKPLLTSTMTSNPATAHGTTTLVATWPLVAMPLP